MAVGRFRRATVTPVLDTNAYADGDQVSTLQTISDILPDHQAGEIQLITVLDKANQKVALDLFFFDSSSVTLAADNAAFTVSDSDMENCVGVVNVAAADYDAVSTTNGFATISINFPIQPRNGNGGDIYMAIVSRGTPTYAASSLVFGFVAESRN